MLEAAVVVHALVEGRLAGVAERRMAEVVRQGDGLGQVFVEAELPGDGAADLGDFQRVRQAGAVMVVGLVTSTCVLYISRRKAVQWTMRSRSR